MSEGLGLEGLSLRLRVYFSRVSSLRFRVLGFRVLGLSPPLRALRFGEFGVSEIGFCALG